jgi:hypothetical protein
MPLRVRAPVGGLGAIEILGQFLGNSIAKPARSKSAQ